MDIKHHVVSEIKRLHGTLGRTPSRDELLSLSDVKRRPLDAAFGSYKNALRAAGIRDNEKEKKPKITTESLFSADIEETLRQYEANLDAPNPFKFKWGGDGIIIFIGDAHFPFVSMRAVKRVFDILAHYGSYIRYVVQGGDLHDMLGASKFPRSQNFYSPEKEIELAYRMAGEFWAKIKALCPNATLIQQLGNHDIRPMKRIVERCPELEHMVRPTFEGYFKFDGVLTNLDYRQEIEFDQDILVHHGYRSKLGDHMTYTLFKCVDFHTHHGGTVYRQIRGGTLWDLNGGFIGDPRSKALGYTAQKTTTQTLGLGMLDSLGPRFIPF
jgi:hypothetical protein